MSDGSDHLLQRFWGRVEERPDRIAVVDGETTTTYGELATRSVRLASALAGSGVEHGDRVAVFVPKSTDALVAFLGTLHLGGIYVPVDPASPADRVARMMAVARPAAAVVARRSRELLDATRSLLADWHPVIGSIDERRGPGGALDLDADDIEGAAGSWTPPIGGGSDVAHILFTSGSTGTPKGVAVRHDNLRHFVDWTIGCFGASHADRFSSHPPFHFDMSTFDIYTSLGAGAQLHLVPPALNLLPHRLFDFVADHEITVWFSVPNVLTRWVSSGAVDTREAPALRHIVWGGETIPISTVRALMTTLPHVELTHVYGPTEATVASSFHRVGTIPDPDSANLPIGKALPGEELQVLDESEEPVAVGTVGQLAICGKGVTDGYWNDQARTAEVFKTRADGVPCYLTGDVAREDSEGRFHFLGRTDDQVKTRGHRVELGEIEAALHRVPVVASAVVVAVEGDAEEGAVVCCALILEEGSADGELDRVRQELGGIVPRYMVPRRWRVVESLPLNSNGKADRVRLREWFRDGGSQ